MSRALALVLLAGCTLFKEQSPGNIHVSFKWPDGQIPPAAQGTYLSAQIRDAQTQALKVPAGPVLYPSAQTLHFDTVPNTADGQKYVMFVQFADGNTSDAQTLYYGQSEPFTLTEGMSVDVAVSVQLRGAPAANPPDGAKVDALAVVDADGHPLTTVNYRTVRLRIVAPVSATNAALANVPKVPSTDESNPSYFALTSPVEGVDVPPGFAAYFRDGWNLDEGRTPCPQGTTCAQQIYVWFSDDKHVRSTAAHTDVVLDTQKPLGTITCTSSLAGLGTVVTCTVVSSKVLSSEPALTITPDPQGAIGLPTLAPGSAGTTWTYAFPAVPSGVAQAYTVTAAFSDSIGNAADEATPGSLSATFSVDGVQPAIASVSTSNADGAVAARFSTVPGFNTVAAVFDVTKALASIRATLGTLPMSCPAPTLDGRHYRCTYEVAGTEPETTLPLLVQVTDLAGNPASAAATVTLDFTPPSIVGVPAITYSPPPDSVLSAVTAAASGAVVHTTFAVSEALAKDPAVASLPAGLPFEIASNASVSYDYAGVVTQTGPPDGQYSLQITLTDTVGNAHTWKPVTPTAHVSKVATAAPPDTATTGRVVYTRIPWGTNATSGTPSFALVGKAGAAPGAATVIAYDRADRDIASQLGRATVDAQGAFSIALSRSDRDTIYLAAVDSAGNISSTARIQDVTWVASYAGKIPGNTLANPHVVTTTSNLRLTPKWPGSTLQGGLLFPDTLFSSEPSSYAGVVAVDATALQVPGTQAVWQRVAQGATSPPERTGAAVATDVARGRVVLFGGSAGDGSLESYYSDTWEWNGTGWTSITTSNGPVARKGQAAVFDAARGKTLLFGGTNVIYQRGASFYDPAARLTSGGDFNDTWEWDGTTWTEVTPAESPSVRWGHAMAYDAARGRVLLFGGCLAEGEASTSGVNCMSTSDETWEWRGDDWTSLTPAHAPAVRYGALMAYDPGRDRTVLFGGSTQTETCPDVGSCQTFPCGQCERKGDVFTDTWEWNGTDWVAQSPAHTPPTGGAMAYDATRGHVVLKTWDETWEWDGTDWTRRAASSDPAGGDALAYDPVNAQALLFNGRTWTWTGTAWLDVTPSAAPPARSGGALTFDATRGTTLLFGGAAKNDTWLWNGGHWTAATPTTRPATRTNHALAFDSTRGRAVLFGGTGASGRLGDTWEWNGSSWQNFTPSTTPKARTNLAMTYDSVRGRVVLFGGIDASFKALDDTWEWTGSAWVQSSVATRPAARYDHALAYDSDRHRTVLFGGNVVNSYANDTWEWDGTGWTRIQPSASPPARGGHGLAYDTARRRILLVGGSGAEGDYNDVWEYDGQTWRQLVALDSPTGAAALAYDTARQRAVLFAGDTTRELVSAARPHAAALAGFSFAAAQATSPVLQEISWSARAGGVGSAFEQPGPGTLTPGVSLAAWDAWSATWKVLDSNSNLPAAPGVLQYTTTSPGEAARYFVARPQTINAALISTADSANGTSPAAVSVDYLELTVKYRQ